MTATPMVRLVTGLASAYALDSYDDEIEHGAYDEWLSDFRAGRTGPIPFVDSHAYGSIRTMVGKAVAAQLVPEGLEVTFEMLQGDPEADMAWRRAEAGLVTGLSIGYRSASRAPTPEERARGVGRVLTRVDIGEVSLVHYPANPITRVRRTMELPAAEAVQARRLAASEQLTSRITKLQAHEHDRRLATVREVLAKAHAAGYGPMPEADRLALAQRLQRLDIGRRLQQSAAEQDHRRRVAIGRVLARGAA
jgi:HK97 family phage prohead protease